MDRDKLRQLVAKKLELDAVGASLMEEVQQWKVDVIAIVGETNFDSQKGFMWDKILLEVLAND
jgi:hypothetical protein